MEVELEGLPERGEAARIIVVLSFGFFVCFASQAEVGMRGFEFLEDLNSKTCGFIGQRSVLGFLDFAGFSSGLQERQAVPRW